MDYEAVISSFNDALSSGKTIVLGFKGKVVYSGRAESVLQDGDRLAIIKSDRTLLIHQPSGSNPVNYMKEGSEHHLKKDEHNLVLSSRNLPLKEFMDIYIKAVYFLHAAPLLDSQKLQLAGTEREMALMLMQNPGLIEQGFTPLSNEEHTKYGFIDVFGYDRSQNLVVVECKRQQADLSAVTQLRRYVEKIKKMKGLARVRGVLAAPKISPNALAMLTDWGFEFRAVSPPNYFERHSQGQKSLEDF